MNRLIIFFILISSSLVAENKTNLSPFSFESKDSYFYPNFSDNPYLDVEKKKKIKPHLLPLDHPIKPILDKIFATRVTVNKEIFFNSGFVKLSGVSGSHVQVTRHPKVPGYILKIYLDDSSIKRGKEGWEWLVSRCRGAQIIRKFVRKHNIQHFTAPKKWLYPLPVNTLSDPKQHPVILIAQDMKIVDKEHCIQAWQEASTDQLQELHTLLKNGFSSTFLIWNIPYTKNGRFTCIDTEHPKRKLDLRKVKPYLSNKNKAFWDELLNKKE